MKRIIFDVDDAYASVISVTFVGSMFGGVRVSTRAADLTKHDYFSVDKNGDIIEHKTGTNYMHEAQEVQE